MKKDPTVYLKHILECIGLIEEYIDGLTKAQFIEQIPIQDAVIRRLEIIGEAARNLPDEFKKEYSTISWKEILGARNILAHHYFGIDLDIVWDIAKKDLKPLKEQIEMMLEA